MAKLFFDQVMEFLGVPSGDDNQPVQADDPLGTSDPQFGYRDYTPAERAQEVVTGGLDTAGSVARGLTKGALELPRDIAVLGTTIAQSQGGGGTGYWSGIQRNEKRGIMDMLQQADKSVPSWLPNEQTIERALPEMTPMSRTYAQDASVYNVPEEIGRFAAPIPLLEVGRLNKIGKLPRILEDGMLTDEAVSALGRIPAGMSIEEVSYRGAHQAPRREEGVRSSLDDMSDIYPEDVYDPRVSPRYYGHTGAGDPNDIRSAELVAAYQGKPEAEVTIYRAVPKGQGITDINKGDWVTLNPNYAASHGNAALGGNYEIISKKVKAKDIISDGNSIHEFGYDPVVEANPARILPTPRILSAANPETGRTGFTSGGGTQIPALEPLREPTRMGGMNTLGNEDVLRQARFNMQKLDRTPQQILDEVLNDPNAVNVVGEAERDAREMLGYGQFERLDDKEMQGVINMRNNLLVDRTRQFDRETLITPMSERQSVIATDRPQRAMPRILEDTPKVEKLPPMLRDPIEKTGNYPATGTYSRLHQALLDIKNDPKVPASMTPRDLSRRLDAMGVTKADLEEHGLNLADYTRLNANGNQVVDIKTIADNAIPPQDRMDRVILEGGRDAEPMDLEQNQDQFRTQDYEEYTGYNPEPDIEDGLSDVATSVGGRDFADWNDQAKDVHQILKNKYISEGMTPSDAQMSAIDIMVRAEKEASDNWLDWLTDPIRNNGEYDYRLEEQVRDAMEERARDYYEQHPVFDDTITFAGEQYSFVGNEDIGFRVFDGQGNQIANNIFSLNEVEVQIQNDAMNAGIFGYGGEGSMKWTGYLQGDSDYFEPIEEVILTYDPKTGNTFESSHYGSDVAEGYVAHLRATSRETADGDSVYHVDEIQSDLHQEGRQTGYFTPESKKELRQANADYKAAQEAGDEIYADLRDNVSIPNIDEIGMKLRPESQNRIFNMMAEGRITPEEFDQKVKLIVLDEITDALDPVKLLKDEKINDPDLMRYAEAKLAGREAYSNVRRLEQLGSAPSSEYPLKDERWIKAMVRQAMERAVSKGNFDGITFSNPQNQINQWSSRYEKLYNEVYENKLKSILETIGKEYGVKPRKVKLNDPEMQEAGENWYLPLSKDMMETIKKRGVPLASAVGVTPAILDRINKEREDKTPRILRTA